MEANEPGGTGSWEDSPPESTWPGSPAWLRFAAATITPLGSGALRAREKHALSLSSRDRSLTGRVACSQTTAVQC